MTEREVRRVPQHDKYVWVIFNSQPCASLLTKSKRRPRRANPWPAAASSSQQVYRGGITWLAWRPDPVMMRHHNRRTLRYDGLSSSSVWSTDIVRVLSRSTASTSTSAGLVSRSGIASGSGSMSSSLYAASCSARHGGKPSAAGNSRVNKHCQALINQVDRVPWWRS